MNARVELDETEYRAREVAAFRSEFLRYAAMDDLRQPCPIGRLVDRGLSRSLLRQTVAEVIADELEYSDFQTRAIELLCKLAQGFCQAEAAHKLLLDLADGWADKRSEL